MSAHTPGPWSIEISANTGKTVRIVHNVNPADGLGDDICRLGDVRTPGYMANARLIIAAPRMLAYLKQTMAQVDDNMHFMARAILREIEGEGK